MASQGTVEVQLLVLSQLEVDDVVAAERAGAEAADTPVVLACFMSQFRR